LNRGTDLDRRQRSLRHDRGSPGSQRDVAGGWSKLSRDWQPIQRWADEDRRADRNQHDFAFTVRVAPSSPPPSLALWLLYSSQRD
jgi:hypothetical protein